MSSDGRPTYRHVARQALTPFLPALPAVRKLRQLLARERFIIRVKTAALAVGATVDLEVASDVIVDGPPSIEIYADTTNRLHIGGGSRIGDGVRFSLRGGSLDVGKNAELRRLGTYQLTGSATIGDDVVMSTGVVVHCADSIEIGDLTIIGEYVTITDSSHVRTPPDVAVHHSIDSKPVRIGRNAWLGAHCVIAAGIQVGDQSFVGAGAVVTKDVTAGWLVAGVPARPVREL